MKVLHGTVVFLAWLSTAFCEMAIAQSGGPPPAGGAPRTIAEKIVDALPSEPLYWSVNSFGTLDQAKKAAGAYSLAAESDGKAWLFTLGPKAGSSNGGTAVVDAGPITPPKASRFLLRISESITTPGRVTPIHTHPGSEAFYLLKGEVEYKTTNRIYKVSAGNASPGPPPDTPMQATTTGSVNAHNLIMFILDADKPAQAPSHF
jgi:hypothetical protein